MMKSPVYSAKTRGIIGYIEEPGEPELTLEQAEAQEHASQQANRRRAYQREADPLFFKWQAGEATQEEWEAARQAIRDRYPYPGE